MGKNCFGTGDIDKIILHYQYNFCSAGLLSPAALFYRLRRSSAYEPESKIVFCSFYSGNNVLSILGIMRRAFL